MRDTRSRTVREPPIPRQFHTNPFIAAAFVVLCDGGVTKAPGVLIEPPGSNCTPSEHKLLRALPNSVPNSAPSAWSLPSDWNWHSLISSNSCGDLLKFADLADAAIVTDAAAEADGAVMADTATEADGAALADDAAEADGAALADDAAQADGAALAD